MYNVEWKKKTNSNHKCCIRTLHAKNNFTVHTVGKEYNNKNNEKEDNVLKMLIYVCTEPCDTKSTAKG